MNAVALSGMRPAPSDAEIETLGSYIAASRAFAEARDAYVVARERFHAAQAVVRSQRKATLP